MVTGLISLCVAGISQEANFVNVLREFITSLRPVDPWEFFKYRNIFLSTNEPDPGHVSKSFSPKHVKAQTKSNFTSIHCRPPGSATHLRRQFGCPAICNRWWDCCSASSALRPLKMTMTQAALGMTWTKLLPLTEKKLSNDWESYETGRTLKALLEQSSPRLPRLHISWRKTGKRVLTEILLYRWASSHSQLKPHFR